ncbi:MAG: hypothetical protein HY905_03700 [Deltaproteobacteria bacterium]|nr:hypothetical protein [Deltaproteobacteria bacterium]
MEATQDTVSSALGEILGIEQDRVRSEAEAQRRAEELERRERAEADRLRQEETERREREGELLQAEVVRREREQVERREQERRLAELRVRRETDAQAHLAEEELRLRHERELAAVEAGRRRVPAWVWVVSAVFAAAGVVVAVLWVQASAAADEALAAAGDRHERDRAAWQGERQGLVGEVRELRSSAATLTATVREDERRLAELEPQVAKAAADRLRVGELELAKGKLEQRVADLEALLALPCVGSHRPTDVRPPPPPPPPPQVVTQCVNTGTPLEECFSCPGDRRCRPVT